MSGEARWQKNVLLFVLIIITTTAQTGRLGRYFSFSSAWKPGGLDWTGQPGISRPELGLVRAGTFQPSPVIVRGSRPTCIYWNIMPGTNMANLILWNLLWNTSEGYICSKIWIKRKIDKIAFSQIYLFTSVQDTQGKFGDEVRISNEIDQIWILN